MMAASTDRIFTGIMAECYTQLPMTLREVLHAHIPVLDESSTVRDAIDKMDIYQFPGLVIIDSKRQPVGVIMEGDLVRAAQQRDSITSIADEPAYIYSSKEPTCLPAETEIGEAFYRMAMSGLTLLPVVDDDVLAGVVLRVDLMQAILADANA